MVNYEAKKMKTCNNYVDVKTTLALYPRDNLRIFQENFQTKIITKSGAFQELVLE